MRRLGEPSRRCDFTTGKKAEVCPSLGWKVNRSYTALGVNPFTNRIDVFTPLLVPIWIETEMVGRRIGQVLPDTEIPFRC